MIQSGSEQEQQGTMHQAEWLAANHFYQRGDFHIYSYISI